MFATIIRKAKSSVGVELYEHVQVAELRRISASD